MPATSAQSLPSSSRPVSTTLPVLPPSRPATPSLAPSATPTRSPLSNSSPARDGRAVFSRRRHGSQVAKTGRRPVWRRRGPRPLWRATTTLRERPHEADRRDRGRCARREREPHDRRGPLLGRFLGVLSERPVRRLPDGHRPERQAGTGVQRETPAGRGVGPRAAATSRPASTAVRSGSLRAGPSGAPRLPQASAGCAARHARSRRRALDG